jgi:hypothetical protein
MTENRVSIEDVAPRSFHDLALYQRRVIERIVRETELRMLETLAAELRIEAEG